MSDLIEQLREQNEELLEALELMRATSEWMSIMDWREHARNIIDSKLAAARAETG
jgi:hypothetical protein